MKYNYKNVYFIFILVLFLTMVQVVYTLVFSLGRGRDFSCSTDLYIEDTQRKEILDAKFSIVMTRNNIAIMDIFGVVKKDDTRYSINKKIVFDYIDNQLKGFVHLKKKSEEGYASQSPIANEVFNRLMYNDKSTLYASISKLDNGAFEISDTLNPVLVCYER